MNRAFELVANVFDYVTDQMSLLVDDIHDKFVEISIVIKTSLNFIANVVGEWWRKYSNTIKFWLNWFVVRIWHLIQIVYKLSV